MIRFVAALAIGCSALLIVGCGSDKSSPSLTPVVTPTQATEADTGPKSAGRLVFDSQKCTDCHSINGSALTGKMKAPDLSRIGAAHPQDWIVAHIRDPKSHKPMSRMPAYGEDELNAKDATTLGQYLASLK